MARQLKLDELNRNTVVTLVSVGVSQRQAAMHVGCDASTITKLATRDEAFAVQLRDARRRAQQEPLELIKKHADKSWRAAAWLLEKSHPHLYGKQAGKVSEQALEEQRIELVQILADEIGDAELLDRIIDRLHQLEEAKLPPVEEIAPAEEVALAKKPATTVEPISAAAAVPPQAPAVVDATPPQEVCASPSDIAVLPTASAATSASNESPAVAKASKPAWSDWARYYQSSRVYAPQASHAYRPPSGKPACKSRRRQQSCGTRRGKKKGRR